MKLKLISVISALTVIGVGSLLTIPSLLIKANNTHQADANKVVETNDIKHSESIQVVNSVDSIVVDVVKSGISSSGAIVNNNGKQEIYVWGKNNYGQLGLGDTKSRLSPTLLDSSLLGNYLSIKEFKIINDCNTVVTVNTSLGEQIYVFGRNDFGQLGVASSTNQSRPILFDTTQFGNYISIKEINFATSFGGNYKASSYAIIQDNLDSSKVFVWGQNDLGQLGLGDFENKFFPVEFDVTVFGPYYKIRELRISDISYAVVYEDSGINKLFTWGKNNYGQLGLGDKTNKNVPTELTSIQIGYKYIKFVKAFNSNVMLMVLTANGIDELYSWGYYNDAQLGLGSLSSNVATPTRVTQAALGGATEILTINGNLSIFLSVKINEQIKLITWGKNTYGEALSGNTSVAWSPILINNSKFGNYIEIYDSVFTNNVSEWNGNSAYAYVKTISGDQFYTWGNNSNGQLGIGTVASSVTNSTLVNSLNLNTGVITDISKNFGTSNMIRIKRNNAIEFYSVGNNADGSLGNGSTVNSSTFTQILPIRYTNPIPYAGIPTLSAAEALVEINPNGIIDIAKLSNFVDITSFPSTAILKIDMENTFVDLQKGILKLSIITNEYNDLLTVPTIESNKKYELNITGFRKATNIETNPVKVISQSFADNGSLTIEKLYNQIVDANYQVINRALLEQYLDLTSIPPTATLYLYRTSYNNDLQATFSLTSNKIYANDGITVDQEYTQTNLLLVLTVPFDPILVISLSVLGGVFVIGAIILFLVLKRSSNRIRM